MKSIILSIIVPVYNVQEYLLKCLNSITLQTYKGSIECLIVDDCGTDDSILKAEQFINNYHGNIQFIIIHRLRNGGLSAARNTGLDHAKGKYVYFLDSDDYIEPDLCQNTIEKMEKGYDTVSFGYVREHIMDGVIYEFKLKPQEFINLTPQDRILYIYKELLQYHFGWEAWGRMFRRDIIERNKLRFEDNNIIYAEDIYFLICYSLVSSKHVCISTAHYHYVERDDSIMGSLGKKSNVNRLAHLCSALNVFVNTTPTIYNYKNYMPLIWYSIIKHEAIKKRHNYNDVIDCKDPERTIIINNLKKIQWNCNILNLIGLKEFCSVKIDVHRLVGMNNIWDRIDHLSCKLILKVLCKLGFL